MRIGIMTPGVTKGDAISNDAKSMAKTLRLAGHDVSIFTNTPPSTGAAKVYTYQDVTWKLNKADDIIIYHYCIHDQAALKAIRKTPARVILRYHNVTPSAFFLGYMNDYVQSTKLGRSDLRSFLELPIICTISDSSYNREELLNLGMDRAKSFVLPPLSHTDDLLASNSDQALENHLRGMQLNILTVGRIVPNKRTDFLVASLAILLKKANIDVHLHILGKVDPRIASYKHRVDTLVEQHNLRSRVHFHSEITNSQLATFYRVCDLLWIGSQHEGFCVPASEAMAFGLPIVATPNAAIPETCGDAALYGTTEDEHADLILRLLTDDVYRNHLGALGRRRFAERFANPLLRASLLEIIDEVEGRQVDSPFACLRRNWLSLPNYPELVAEIIATWSGPQMYWTEERDHYLDVLAWAIEDGQHRSPKLYSYFRSETFRNYLDLEFRSGGGGQAVMPMISFVYTVCRWAQAYFVLQTDDSFISFVSWFYRVGAQRFGLEDVIHRREGRVA